MRVLPRIPSGKRPSGGSAGKETYISRCKDGGGITSPLNTMKTLVLLLTVVASVAPHGGQIVYPSSQPSSPVGDGPDGVLYLGACSAYTSTVHATNRGSAYHFSWCYDGGQKYTWEGANSYCQRLGAGWGGVAIESPEENYFITSIIESHRLPYLWTSGQLRSLKTYHTSKDVWVWVATKNRFTYYNWGRTGELGRPQPDNNENGNERCMGILNHFYPGDTTTWHDIGCHHTKPIVCERYGSPSYSG